MTVASTEEYDDLVEKVSHFEIVPRTDTNTHATETSKLKDVEADEKTKRQTTSTNKRAILNQVSSACAVLLLAGACGMPIGFSAVLLPQLYNNTTPFTIDVEMGSWIASVHSLATPVGSIISGPCADYLGRRTTLLYSLLPTLLGWSLIALSQSYTMVLVGRFITGCAVGILGAPAQVYIAETADPNLRSILIGAPFLSYSVGILFVYVLGSLLHWQIVAWVGNCLPIIAALALLLIPETPVWLARNKRPDKALKALQFLRNDDVLAKTELNSIQQRINQEIATAKSNENILQLCSQPAAIKPLFIVITFSILQMLSGTFLVVFYAIDIIAEIDSNIDPKKAAVLTSIVRTACTFFICVILLFIRRRVLTIISALGSGLSCLLLSVYMFARQGMPFAPWDVYVKIACLIFYITFNTPMMIMPGILVGEAFPAKIRGRTAGAMFTACNISLFILAKTFPMINAAIKTKGIFMLFAIASFVAAIFTYLLQPETKGRTLDEIEDYFNESNWFWCRRSEHFRKKKTVTIA